MKSPQIIYQVDAFTTEAFKGNPAGVWYTRSGTRFGMDAECCDGDESF